MNISLQMFSAACLFAAFAIPSVAQSPAGSLTTDPVYEKSCAKCHGKTAEGRHFGGPSLATSKLSDEELRTIIANGKGRMPKFSGKLTDQKIATLTQEIKALSAGSSK